MNQQIKDPKLERMLSQGYRAAEYGKPTCDGCISNIKGQCDVLETPIDCWHVCNNRMTEKEAEFLADRLRGVLFGPGEAQ